MVILEGLNINISMTTTLTYIEEQLQECDTMIRHFRSQWEIDRARQYEAKRDLLIKVKTIYLEEHGITT